MKVILAHEASELVWLDEIVHHVMTIEIYNRYMYKLEYTHDKYAKL